MESWKTIVSFLVDRVEEEGREEFGPPRGKRGVEECRRKRGRPRLHSLVYPVLPLPLLTGLIILSILCGVGS